MHASQALDAAAGVSAKVSQALGATAGEDRCLSFWQQLFSKNLAPGQAALGMSVPGRVKASSAIQAPQVARA